jgi:hypothetical protein
LSNRTVSAWSLGQLAGRLESLIGRLTTNVLPHWRQRNSYAGMDQGYDGGYVGKILKHGSGLEVT